MSTAPLWAPGAPVRHATIRAALAPLFQPARGLPTDGEAAGSGGGGDGGGGVPASAGAGPGPVPGSGGGPVGGEPSPPATPSPASVPAPGYDRRAEVFGQPAGQPAAPDGGSGGPQGQQPQGGERSLDDYPPELRGYIADLRKENGDNRVKAQKAAEAAQKASEQAEAQKQEWLTNFAKSIGLMTDDPEVPAEQRVEQLTGQVTAAQNEHRAATVELAIWKAAAAAGANPQRLTDSRTFMRQVDGLDPSAADFAERVSQAIASAVDADGYYRAAGPAPAPTPQQPVQPPVASGGDFAGGPSGGAQTGPQTVEDFRDLLRQRGVRT